MAPTGAADVSAQRITNRAVTCPRRLVQVEC